MAVLLSSVRPRAARLRWVSESLQRGQSSSLADADRATMSAIAKTGAMQRAGTRQYASSAVACRTWSSLRSHSGSTLHTFSVSIEGAQAAYALTRGLLVRVQCAHMPRLLASGGT